MKEVAMKAVIAVFEGVNKDKSKSDDSSHEYSVIVTLIEEAVCFNETGKVQEPDFHD